MTSFYQESSLIMCLLRYSVEVSMIFVRIGLP